MIKHRTIAGGRSMRFLPLVCAAVLTMPVMARNGLNELPINNAGVWQQRAVSGRVTNAVNNTPVVGASVIVKGTTTGTTTDEEGRFTIQAAPGSTLVISYLGLVTQEIAVGQSNSVSVQLRDDSQSLDQVVVVGYGTQKRKEITSAVTSVKATDFNPGGTRSPMDLIQGKVAGLNITRANGNNPNSGASIQLRGITSVNGTQTPLIVIDGIPGGNLDLLQQDDIESFDVLKDGSAAAIYGTRGNAGVILITTKKGKAGAPRYDFATYLQREYVDRKPEYLSAADFRKLIADGVIAENQDFGASTDMYDELIDRQNLSQYYNFSASGGTTKSNYRASIYYNDANGIAKQNGREQFGGRININQKGLQDRLTLSANLAANMNKANLLGGGGGDFEQAIQRNPTAPIYNPDGTFLETQNFNNYNPLARLQNRISERDQQSFSGDARLSLEIVKGLTASVFGAYLRDTYNDRFYRSTKDWDQRPASSYRGFAYGSKSNRLYWSKTLESTLNYTKQIGEKHNITALAGYSYQYETVETFNVNNNGITTDAFLDWNLGSGSAIQNTLLPRPGLGSFKEDNTLIAFFGRLNYSYDDRFFLTGLVRREGSSRFGANYKWGNFPAVSAGWMISEENFMEGISMINQLKLRVGYGVTGNQGIPNYLSLTTFGTGGVYPQNGVFYQTYGLTRNPNPNLRWEQKAEWNVGLDFSLLNNKITGALDVYRRTTNDLLFQYAAQQPSFAASTIWTNVGSIRSSGVELQVSAQAIQNKDFQWSIDFAGQTQKNILTRLSNDVFKADFLEFYGLPSPGALGNAFRIQEGWDVGNFYGYRFAGFTEEGLWEFYKADGSKGLAGQMNNNDRAIIGNGVPKLQLSLNNRFTYKNFDLNIFFRGKFMYDILNTKDLYFGNKRWLPNNLLKSAITTHNQLNDAPQYSDYYLEKGDFVKLDNLTIGYNFQLNTSYIRNMRLYITGRNLATFTGYSGIDPELQDTGFEPGVDMRGFYPRTRSMAIGLNVGF